MLFRNDRKDNRERGGSVRLPLLPLRDIIVFPHMVVPLFVGRQKSIKALEEAVASKKLVFLATQRDAKVNDPTSSTVETADSAGNGAGGSCVTSSKRTVSGSRLRRSMKRVTA